MKLSGTKKILGGLALAGTIALTAGVGVAQQETKQGQGAQEQAGREWKRGGHKGHRGMRGGRGFGGHFAEKLNLTDAQKEQMRQISARYRETAKATRDERRGGRGGNEFDAFNGGAFDEAAVRAAAQARANAQVERQVAHARMMHEMYNVLTAEQKAQLAAERQQREQRRQERRTRRNADPGVNQ